MKKATLTIRECVPPHRGCDWHIAFDDWHATSDGFFHGSDRVANARENAMQAAEWLDAGVSLEESE